MTTTPTPAPVSANQPIFLPSLGMTGRWSLNAPYASLVMATMQYRCTGILSLQGAVANGADPLNSVYLANKDTQANYEQDLANGDYLITISSGPGDVVTFPRSAMTSLPDSDGELYHNVMLGISLSAIPDSLNLDPIKQQVQALVLSVLGVKSTVYAATIGGATLLTTTDAAALEAARQMQITSPESLAYQNQQHQATITSLQQQVQILSDYIGQHFASVSSTTTPGV